MTEAKIGDRLISIIFTFFYKNCILKGSFRFKPIISKYAIISCL